MLLVVWALGFLSISPCGVVKVPSSNYMVFVYRSRHEETGLCGLSPAVGFALRAQVKRKNPTPAAQEQVLLTTITCHI